MSVATTLSIILRFSFWSLTRSYLSLLWGYFTRGVEVLLYFFILFDSSIMESICELKNFRLLVSCVGLIEKGEVRGLVSDMVKLMVLSYRLLKVGVLGVFTLALKTRERESLILDSTSFLSDVFALLSKVNCFLSCSLEVLFFLRKLKNYLMSLSLTYSSFLWSWSIGSKHLYIQNCCW